MNSGSLYFIYCSASTHDANRSQVALYRVDTNLINKCLMRIKQSMEPLDITDVCDKTVDMFVAHLPTCFETMYMLASYKELLL